MLSTKKRKVSISVCYLIDVSPEKFTGGGQMHLSNLVREIVYFPRLKRPGLAVVRPGLHIFGGSNPHVIFRFCWMFYVIPQIIIHHFFRKRFDLIHAHSIPAMVSGKILSLILRVPIVVTVHGAWMRNPIEKFILTSIAYDAQTTVSRDFLKYENINKNIVYIPNGVNIDAFKGSALSRQGRALSNRRTVLFVGRKNDPVKGFAVLEEAMREVRRKILDVQLTVAGGDVPHPKLIDLYRNADLFVLPSLSEGFPLTLLEAWAARLPVIATAVGECQYLVRNGFNGYLVAPGDKRALAQAIIKALRSASIAKIGQNGYNLARKFTWKNVAQKTISVYQRIYSIF